MKASNLRELNTQELESKVSELKGELFNLRFQLATGQLENSMRIKEVKKNIARTQTVLKEKQLSEVQG